MIRSVLDLRVDLDSLQALGRAAGVLASDAGLRDLRVDVDAEDGELVVGFRMDQTIKAPPVIWSRRSVTFDHEVGARIEPAKAFEGLKISFSLRKLRPVGEDAAVTAVGRVLEAGGKAALWAATGGLGLAEWIVRRVATHVWPHIVRLPIVRQAADDLQITLREQLHLELKDLDWLHLGANEVLIEFAKLPEAVRPILRAVVLEDLSLPAEDGSLHVRLRLEDVALLRAMIERLADQPSGSPDDSPAAAPAAGPDQETHP
jgi:hypothetical protein